MEKELEKAYALLEPVKHARLELNNFTGVYLQYTECVKVVKELGRMEYQVEKSQKDLDYLKERNEQLEKRLVKLDGIENEYYRATEIDSDPMEGISKIIKGK